MQSRREVQQAQSRSSAARRLRNVLLVILFVILVGWLTYAASNQPRHAAKKQATQMAEKYAHLQGPQKFYIYNRESTFYTVTGKNQQGQPILVMVPQKGGHIRVLKQSAGLTANQVTNMTKQLRHPSTILKVALGIFNDKTVWEVTYRNRKGQLCYDLINFKTGKYVQEINNL
ncbi:cell wall elongation regulator TseB-like domain-containing protein [Limosilactobacillus panis]|uniref:DUF5590 domain-containing protein n=1 Tax=Limosilactobacillus panis TaxID=47493 RepID=A0ABT7VM04_9LACO|nr:DUF5590 domain-containing protein [Limosilactobacillus panis]MDM8333596.1 DUF5590 domain-containing protein [Limosilactobacillus panis]